MNQYSPQSTVESLVISLEYAAFAWPPYTKININKLESVHRRAARYVMSDFNKYSSVSEILSILAS